MVSDQSPEMQAIAELGKRRQSYRFMAYLFAIVAVVVGLFALGLGGVVFFAFGAGAITLAELITRAMLTQRDPIWVKELAAKYNVPPEQLDPKKYLIR
jgi:hypothetical protein